MISENQFPKRPNSFPSNKKNKSCKNNQSSKMHDVKFISRFTRYVKLWNQSLFIPVLCTSATILQDSYRANQWLSPCFLDMIAPIKYEVFWRSSNSLIHQPPHQPVPLLGPCCASRAGAGAPRAGLRHLQTCVGPAAQHNIISAHSAPLNQCTSG